MATSVAGQAGSATLALLTSLILSGASHAQTVGAPAKHNNNTYGSPLDTMKSSRLWTDTPVPQGFVRDSRPDPATLDYTPLSGVDPARPKPRDAANVAALQAEMERAGARLAGKAGRPPRTARTAPAASAAAKPRRQAGTAAAD